MKLVSALLLACGLLAGQSADLDIPFEKYKLKNGLRVILSRDPSVPVVSIYVLYGVGARSEEKGRTGFAHLFEHMMFQGSANAPKGLHFKLVEANGGNLNGSTHPDFTDYYELLPSNKLAVGLWLEADRMRSLAITKENLDNQKEAVKQERRLSFDNRPYATAIVDRWPEVAFQNWQNQHSIIGSFEDLNAASVEDVGKFFKTYYAPNNAVLAVVGDIELAEAKKWIETYFADIPPQPQPKHPDLAEPPAKARQEVYKDKLAKVPAVIIGYPGPVRRSPDYYALAMADVLLTAGESSRFQQELVKGKQSVINYEANLGWPFTSASDYKDPNVYGMYFLHNPKFTAAQIIEQVEAQLERLKTEPVSAKELKRAQTFLRAARIGELQSSMNRARLLAQYELFDGKPELLRTELNQMLAVTPEQIQAAARKYFQDDKQITLQIVPAPAAPPAAPAKKEGE